MCSQEVIEAMNAPINTNLNWNDDSSWKSMEDLIGEVENSIIDSSLSPSDNDIIGYEELPRAEAKSQKAKDTKYNFDNFSHSNWDDDTLSSNFCSDIDHGMEKVRNGTHL